MPRRHLQQVSPDTGTTTHTHDAAGNVVSSTDARGVVTTYTYDALNRVTSVTYPDQSIVYTYDQGANGKGRLSAMNDASGLTEWEYDPHGRVTVKRQTTTVTRSHPDYPPFAPVIYAYQYTYDSAGRLASIGSPSGRVLAYSHDAAGRLSAITLNGQPLVHEIQWHPFGRVTGWRWANGKSYARAFD